MHINMHSSLDVSVVGPVTGEWRAADARNIFVKMDDEWQPDIPDSGLVSILKVRALQGC